MSPREFINFRNFEVEVLRKKGRRSLRLEIRPPLDVVLKCSSSTNLRTLTDFLHSRERWILKHRTRIGEGAAYPELQTNEFYFAGQKWNRAGWEKTFAAGYTSKNDADSFFVKTFRLTAQNFIDERVAHWVNSTGLSPEAVRYGVAQTRWGSCSSQRILRFNLRLIQAPPPVIDSVIIHELCHLEHMNHSRAFWSLVLSHYPNYKTNHVWLKKNQYFLLGTRFPWAWF